MSSRDREREAVLSFVTTIPDDDDDDVDTVKRVKNQPKGKKSTATSPNDNDDDVDDDVDATFVFDAAKSTVAPTWSAGTMIRNALAKAAAQRSGVSSVDEKIRQRLALKRLHAKTKIDTDQVVVDAAASASVAPVAIQVVDNEHDDDKEQEQEAKDDDDEDDDDDDEGDDDDDEDDDDEDAVSIDANDVADLNDFDAASLPQDTLKEVKRKGRQRKLEDEYFSDAPSMPVASQFSEMNLSRQLLKAISDIGWFEPTPIQARMVPIVMLGRDVCANAVTGSGKTAAFTLPVLERLVHRPAGVRATVRCVIMLPTRELASQCFEVVSKLARFINVDVAVVAGGTSIKEEEVSLRKLPDIVVATPGRFIDHVRNTRGFHIDDLEILILDEADRLLELGFADELEEIVRLCPTKRQTVLTSATMTTAVERLTKLSLRDPIRLTVDPLLGVARSLTQEFIRVKDANPVQRTAILLSLLTRSVTDRAIIFASLKVEVHRLRLLLGLCGLSVAELHGDMKQHERLEALEMFRDGRVAFLIATDVAARGLDIAGVQHVINFTMPRNHKSYIHRVGRTARAKQTGRAISLIGQRDRPLLKQIVKLSTKQVLQRVVPPESVLRWAQKVAELEDDVDAILKSEKRDRQVDAVEMQYQKAKNMLTHEHEIKARPARTWFQTAADKQATVEAARVVEDDNGELDIERAKRIVAEVERDRRKKRKAPGGDVADDGTPKKTKEKKLTRKQRRALAVFEPEEIESGMRRQHAAKKLYNKGKLAIGNKASKIVKREARAEKRRWSESEKEAARGKRGEESGDLTFAAEMAKLEERDRLMAQKKRRVGDMPGRHKFKSAARYKRKK